MAFPPDFLDELRARVSLESVVGRHVKLTKKGREHHGLCPFHNEKSPSFTVNEEKGFTHCFGCGHHSDAIGFTMQAEHLSFPEAVERLAADVGLQVPTLSPEERQKESKRADLLRALELACLFFESQLQTDDGAAALAYLTGRGLTEDTIGRFRLGWAPEGWDNLRNFLQDKNIPESIMVDAGLIKISDKGGNRSFDYFRGRVMFPITDWRGQVIAFGARTLKDEQPKYLNSPETSLFHKGSTLYGLAHARTVAAQGRKIAAVEGYMDVIQAHQAGVAYVVAPLGTAVTERQIEELWRYADEPVLCLDGDSAGQNAMFRAAGRALPILRPGKSIRFATLPAGEDPDTLVRTQGGSAFEVVLDENSSLADVVWRLTTDQRQLDTPERRAAVEKDLAEKVQSIRDKAVRDQYGLEFKRRLAAAGIIDQPEDPVSGESGGVRYQATDPASLLAPPDELRDDKLPARYLASRLGVAVDELLLPSTPMVGWRELPYFDPPKVNGGGPVFVGAFPCAVFATSDLTGRSHAHRIYVAADGTAAQLGTTEQGWERSPEKSARRSQDDDVRGLGVVWGEVGSVLQVLLCQSIDTGAAIAQAFQQEIAARKLAVVAALTPGGIEHFQPLPIHQWVVVCADRDEAKQGRDYRIGERAARAFGKQHHEKVKVKIALPGESGESCTWLHVFVRNGAAAVTHGILSAQAFDATENAHGVEDFRNPYKILNNRFVWEKEDPKTGDLQMVPLTDFTARIVSDIVRDNGADTVRVFEIEATLANGNRKRVMVPADRFAKMDWVVSELGHSARLGAGSTVREHVRAAIQWHSQADDQVIYAHTGFRHIDGQWTYLHSGGGITATGPVSDIRTDMARLADGGYDFPSIAEDPAAIRETMNLILGAARSHVSTPLFSAMWLAPLAHVLPPTCVILAVGLTGTGKTEMCALVQQGFGPTMTPKKLPGSWYDTVNSIEAKTFLTKDAIILIDDFVPRGTREEMARASGNFARILQTVGNHAGKGRQRPDGSLRPEFRPRGLVLSTGEDLVNASSAIARALVVDVTRGDVQFGGGLDKAQMAAADGLFAGAVARYIQWLAARLDSQGERDLRNRIATRFRLYRQSMSQHIRRTSHLRTPENLAYLATGLSFFLEFAQEIGALDAAAAEAKWREWWMTLVKLGEAQGSNLTSSDPIKRFYQALRSAMTSGQAHIADRDGHMPNIQRDDFNELTLGWQNGFRTGDCIGWIDLATEDVYIDPETAMKVVSKMTSEPFQWTKTTLGKRLNEKGLLAQIDKNRGTLTVQRKVAGSKRDVWYMNISTLLDDPEPENLSANVAPPALEGEGTPVTVGGRPVAIPTACGQGSTTIDFQQLVVARDGVDGMHDFNERVSILVVEYGMDEITAQAKVAEEMGVLT